jgi:anti-sigma-K factor RskA
VNCDEAEELLGAYALDALPADEAAAMREHVRGCETHAAKAAELRGVASQLPALAGVSAAPPALRSRVMAAIATEPQEGDVVPTTTVAPRSIETAPSAASREPWYRRGVPAWTLAAAAAVIVGLVAWNVIGGGESSPSAEELASRATTIRVAEVGGASGAVVYFADDGDAAFIAEGVPPVADGETYQMWSIDEDGAATSLGTMLPEDDGRATAVFPLEPAPGASFGVTVEPSGGSAQPTSDPVLIVEF